MSSILDNIKRMISPLSDEDDDYEEIFDDRDSPFIDERPRSIDRGGLADSRRGKVVNIHATTQLKVVLVKPERFEAASEIADHLKEKRTVVVNLESTHKDIARRLIDFLSGVAYAERVSVDTVPNIRKAKAAIKKAFETQIAKKGFSIVEVLSTCPTNWGLSPIEALGWLEENMLPYYPLGVYKDVEGGVKK